MEQMEVNPVYQPIRESVGAPVQGATAPAPPPLPTPPTPPSEPVKELLPTARKRRSVLPCLLVIISLLIILGGVVLFLWQRQQSQQFATQETPPSVETPPAEVVPPSLPVENVSVKSSAVLIREAMAEKRAKKADEVKLGVREITSDYAAGSVSFVGETGGGWWLAAKVGGKWVIVADGNGTVKCSDVKPYSFPKSMVPECFDEGTGQLTQF